MQVRAIGVLGALMLVVGCLGDGYSDNEQAKDQAARSCASFATGVVRVLNYDDMEGGKESIGFAAFMAQEAASNDPTYEAFASRMEELSVSVHQHDQAGIAEVVDAVNEDCQPLLDHYESIQGDD